MSYASFRRTVLAYYRAHGRHGLPWRPPSLKLRKGKQDEIVYKILVSEVMLQQTQVERVIPFYAEFTRRYPTAKKLAAAPLSEVLAAWSGLGYNRRAKLLKEAVTNISKLSYRTKKISVAELERLPGVGPYTARAVAAFAYNADVVFIETNIRTAVIHHFFSKYRHRKSIDDREVIAILEKVLPTGRAREWYSALMDYGAYLKRSGVRVNERSARYAKQAKFEGSLRQARGAILKALTANAPLMHVKKMYPDRFASALAALAKDGLIRKKGRRISLAS